jgi:hypothetical protein
VLSSVLSGFERMAADLSGEDRAMLQAHADKVAALERRIVAGVGACEAPQLGEPPGYDPVRDDDL